MKNILVIFGILVLAGFGGKTVFERLSKEKATPTACTMDAKICSDGSAVGRSGPQCEFAVCPEVKPGVSAIPIVATTTARLQQKITTGGIMITPLEVVEDSRCPVDVQCIQAGTVRLRTVFESGITKEELILKLGSPSAFMKKQVELLSVDPEQFSKKKLTPTSYRFTFRITERAESEKGALEGRMTIGPVCPVERATTTCNPTPAMYEARKVFVYAGDKKTSITTLTPDAHGKFSVTLPAGIYYIDMKHDAVGSISGVPTTITIEKGKTIQLTIDVDTGIR